VSSSPVARCCVLCAACCACRPGAHRTTACAHARARRRRRASRVAAPHAPRPRRTQEVRILKGVRHPNVLFFRGICLQPPMIITELCEHGSVSDVISLTARALSPSSTLAIAADKRAMLVERMTWPGRVRLALDAAKGMLYLHNKDLLHCDLKSPNLLVDKAWTCKVADFGLSRCAAHAVHAVHAAAARCYAVLASKIRRPVARCARLRPPVATSAPRPWDSARSASAVECDAS
jgi:serine/threonine protein kinase